MSDFDSLIWALDGWFDKLLSDLPDALRQRVERDFFLKLWDGLTADQRRSVALQWDYQHDPATEQDREFWWDFYIRKNRIKEEIETWEAVSTPTASDLEKKETRLAELQREFVAIEQKERNARGDYLDPRSKRPETSPVSGKLDYIAYPKALKLLSDRLNATPEEIAAWVWMGPKHGGLTAYLNVNELDPPPRFHYDLGSGDDFNYLSPLMACWFRADDIANFQPADRYITGEALIERWGKLPGIQAEALIRAKIAESRLLDAHPICGVTRGSFAEDESYPSLESGLFVLTHVEEIEAKDFGIDKSEKIATSLRTNERDRELQNYANNLAEQWKKNNRRTFTKREIANELAKSDEWKDMTANRIERILHKEW